MLKDFYLKQAILNDDLDKTFNQARKHAFKGDRSDLTRFESIYGSEVTRVARNIVSCAYQKWKRVQSKTSSIILGGECLFLTLSFKPEVLKSTSGDTRRQYVRKFLKSQCETYVANIDFGSDDEYINRHGKKCKGTAREHYHALVYSSHIDYKPWKDKYGFIDFEHVRPFENDSKAISRYITKLSRHALKSSTSKDGNSPRLIYSRKVVKLPPNWLFDD